MRYIKQQRIKVYTMLYKMLKKKNKGLFIYFCMEREDVWRKVTGMTVKDDDALMTLFDERIKNLYGGNI